MNLKLTGKNALVCASSSGIGKGIANGLLKEGVNVSILGRNEEKLEQTKKELSKLGVVIATVCDLAKKDNIQNVFNRTITEFGNIDILVNNQGGPAPGNFEDITDEQTSDALKINLMSILTLTKLCLPSMKNKKWGRIINILSVSAKESLPNMFLSNTVRPAVLGFSKSIATNYASLGITVNNLLPSAVLSDRTNFFVNKKANDEGISYDESLKQISARLPIKRIATTEEFAQSVVFLASENASYINGVSICVDGGSTKGII
jgi:3-oxoacyl-[acyl-carrier protein] reductase